MQIPFTSPATTDSVLAAFRKTIDQLAGVRDAHVKIEAEKLDIAAQANSDANAARREAEKATAALAKLEAVFG
jgi:hypothetical protein